MAVSRRLVSLASGACLLGGLCAAPPATAAVVDSGTDSGPFSFVEEDFCGVEGLVVSGTGTFEIRFTAHRQGPDGIVYYVQHGTFETRYTNLANGQYVDESSRTTEKDQEIVVSEDTLTITVLATGKDFVKDSEGRLIAANPGQIRYQVLIDHNGTPDDPFDDEFVMDLGLVRESTGRTDDFCSAVVPALTS
jgi:hypothetical protein